MPVNIPRLRWWFAALAVALLAIVTGFYFYGRYRLRSVVRKIPQNIGINIQQSTTGFTFSKSEGGRTVFTIHASQAVQYKGGGRAQLKDVQIIVYGRQANRYDQIYGTNFEYDPAAGTIAALGEVHIDLEGNAEGPINPDQSTPQELKNPIHLKTSGLIFNRNSGVAQTKERLEFRVPQASGSAVGAVYDSKAATLTLSSNIQIHASEPHTADITASRGVIAAGPDRAVLDGVRMERAGGSVHADRMTVLLRPDNTIERVLASGNVTVHQPGKT
ncbi:MAG: LPS export ABC transporter periplasmic protein LptC, partial [Terriglobales bacterium]